MHGLPRIDRSPARRYGAAVGLSAAALLLTWALLPFMQRNIFLFCFAAVVLSAWYGGFGPALLTTLLSVLAVGSLFLPTFSPTLDVESALRILIFSLTALLVASLTESLQRARRLTEAQRAQLAATLASIGDGVITTDMAGRVTFLNQVAAALTGWSPAAAQGHTLDEVVTLIDAATREPVPSLLPQVLATGRASVLTSNLLLLPLGGGERMIDDSLAPIRAGKGDLLGAVLVFRDVSEQRRTEQALQESAGRLRLIADSLPVLISYVDAEQCYRFNNKTYEAWFGSTAADLRGRSMAEVIGAQAYADLRPYIEQALAGQQVTFEQLTHYRLGGPRYIRAMYVPDFDANGSVQGFVVLVEDVSARRRSDEERAQLLQREQAARAEAEQALRLRDQFFSLAAHELKTPLTSLLGNAQLLARRIEQDASSAERSRRSAQLVVEQTRRLNALVSGLLDMSRIQSGQLSIQPQALDLGLLVQRMIEEIQPMLERHSIVCELPATPLLIAGDELRLEQVLQNLLQNALKYSPDASSIRVQAQREGDKAVVAVSDEGIGIAADDLPLLFQRFYRASNANTRSMSGLGIGLYVVKEIVSLHGGTVEVQSVEGQGSTFRLIFPLLASDV